MKIIKIALYALGGLAVLLAGFLWYMGMFDTLKVTEREVGPYTYVYESFVGPYSATQAVFDQVYRNLKADGIETVDGIGLYYDDPAKVAPAKLRSDCGDILMTGDLAKVPELKKKYKIGTVSRKLSMVAEFPVRNPLSYMIGPMKGYSALTSYAKEKGYKPACTYELYLGMKKVWYVMEVVK